MCRWPGSPRWGCLALALILVPIAPARAAADRPAIIPPESQIGRAVPRLQQYLLSPLDGDTIVERAGWRLTALSSGPAKVDGQPKVGRTALRLAGQAEAGGAKGDFPVPVAIPTGCRLLGFWTYLRSDDNVASIGLQVHDNEGEVLLAVVPAEGAGWKWIEFPLTSAVFRPAYPQRDRNGKIDQPIRGVHVVWFARRPGATGVTVNALVAAGDPPAHGPPISVELSAGGWQEPGSPLAAGVTLTNRSEKAVTAEVELSIQRDPALYPDEPPDPEHGSDHARGARSWTEVEGKRIEEGSLTDGQDWTAAGTTWRTDHYTEAFQYVDLGQARRVTHLAYTGGDANWVWKMDLSASLDGKTYQPVPSLTGVDLHQKWGRQPLHPREPFTARYLRLRYHQDGRRSSVIRMPTTLSVYDGVDDETFPVPKTGATVASGTMKIDLPARSFYLLDLEEGKAQPGAYLVAARVAAAKRTVLQHRHLFVMPEPLRRLGPASRFGVNGAESALAPLLRRLGIGWVRFENMKWPMVSPKPGEFRYDGSVGPWHVHHDDIFAAYAAEGISVLPFLFQTAPYASSAGPAIPARRHDAYPPRDVSTFAEFCFQTVARYGAKRHPAEALKSPDHRSALNRISHYEVWNEPNLTSPAWGPWVGTQEQYLDLFRAAAEAIRRADPAARVSNGGYAGIKVETVDALQSHRYRDGKRPLDFVDVLNVHYYSGRQAPEVALDDHNANRDGSGGTGPTYEQELARLVAWRDRHKPGLPIWLTETGYDTGGPYGVSERLQAARLPRVIMLALAAGIDKVFVYREKGSTPSLHAASGLLRDDGSRKPSWQSYATLIRALDGATHGRRVPHPDANVRVYVWARPGGAVLTAWAIDGNARLGLDLGKCVVTDAFGGRSEQSVGKDTPLSIFPIYLGAADGNRVLDDLLERARPAVRTDD